MLDQFKQNGGEELRVVLVFVLLQEHVLDVQKGL